MVCSQTVLSLAGPKQLAIVNTMHLDIFHCGRSLCSIYVGS